MLPTKASQYPYNSAHDTNNGLNNKNNIKQKLNSNINEKHTKNDISDSNVKTKKRYEKVLNKIVEKRENDYENKNKENQKTKNYSRSNTENNEKERFDDLSKAGTNRAKITKEYDKPSSKCSRESSARNDEKSQKRLNMYVKEKEGSEEKSNGKNNKEFNDATKKGSHCSNSEGEDSTTKSYEEFRIEESGKSDEENNCDKTMSNHSEMVFGMVTKIEGLSSKESSPSSSEVSEESYNEESNSSDSSAQNIDEESDSNSIEDPNNRESLRGNSSKGSSHQQQTDSIKKSKPKKEDSNADKNGQEHIRGRIKNITKKYNNVDKAKLEILKEYENHRKLQNIEKDEKQPIDSILRRAKDRKEISDELEELRNKQDYIIPPGTYEPHKHLRILQKDNNPQNARINWKKQPLIDVRHTKSSELKHNTLSRHCDDMGEMDIYKLRKQNIERLHGIKVRKGYLKFLMHYDEDPWRDIYLKWQNVHGKKNTKGPIPVKETRASTLRSQYGAMACGKEVKPLKMPTAKVEQKAESQHMEDELLRKQRMEQERIQRITRPKGSVLQREQHYKSPLRKKYLKSYIGTSDKKKTPSKVR